MSSQMQRVEHPVDANDGRETQQEELAHEVFLEFDVVEVLDEDPAFQEVDGGAYISKHTEIDAHSIENYLPKFGLRENMAKEFVEALGENKGKHVANIFGFEPILTGPPGDGTLDVALLFGKLYMPSLDGFTTGISIEKTRSGTCDIKIKIAGSGAGGSKEYICRITQKNTISATPVDLIIKAKVKLVKWQHFLGSYFYTCHPINISRRIECRIAHNPYEHDDGYDEITSMSGVVDRYNTLNPLRDEEATEEISEKSEINLRADLVMPPKTPTISISGTATIVNKLLIEYSLPAGHQYATYVKNKEDFQNLWAVKSTSP